MLAETVELRRRRWRETRVRAELFERQAVAAFLDQLDQAHRGEVAHDHPLAGFTTADQVDAMQVAEVALQQVVGQERLGRAQVRAAQAATLAMRVDEAAKHAQQADQFVTSRQALRRRAIGRRCDAGR